QRLALMAADPRAKCPKEWPGDDAANKVDAVGIHLGEELREMPSSAKLAGQDSGENGIKASECDQSAAQTEQRPAQHRPAVQCRKQSHQQPGSAQVADAAPQTGVVALEHADSDTERRGEKESEPHPLRRAHGMTVAAEAGRDKDRLRASPAIGLAGPAAAAMMGS